MSENHFGSHFWPFQIDRPFRMSEIHFVAVRSIRKFTFDGISGHFQIDTQLFVFDLKKKATGGHLGWVDNVNYRTCPRYLDEQCLKNVV